VPETIRTWKTWTSPRSCGDNRDPESTNWGHDSNRPVTVVDPIVVRTPTILQGNMELRREILFNRV
jgi:hypothetical protein